MNSGNDAELVIDIKSRKTGWEQSFEELMRRYKGLLYAYILGFVKDRATAEDLLQEVFIRFLYSIKTFNTEKKLTTWLFRISHNLCIDYHRKKKDIVQDDISLRKGNDHNDQGENNSATEEVRYVMSKLELDARSILMLRDALGFDYSEIAELLDMPLGTVKSKISRARERFRTLWNELVVSR